MPNNYNAMNYSNGYTLPYPPQVNPGTGNWYGNYNPQYQNFPQPNVTYQAPQNAQMSTQQNGLNGRIVESKDVLAVTEIPVGSYGVFPTADFSEIYVKRWTAEGKTHVDVYQLNTQTQEVQPEISLRDIQAQVSNLTEKVDSLVAAYVKPKHTVQKESKES